MVKKIDIAGILLDNYTVRELIMKIDRHMSEKSYTTIEEIKMDTLHMAESDEQIKQAIEMLDYTLIADSGILRAADVESIQRKYEIEEHLFFFEIMKRINRNGKTVFLVADSDAVLDEAEVFLKELFERLIIVGKQACTDCTSEAETVVNEINIAAPDVVLSFLPSPEQELFLLNNKDKLSTNLWYGIGNTKFIAKKPGMMAALKRMLDVKRLTKLIKNYQNREEES